MTALEYMQKQLDRYMVNYGRAVLRNATQVELERIRNKIGYYSEAVQELKKAGATE